MNVTVLYGGPSAERQVSLISGKAVADGLVSMGNQVFLADIVPNDLSALDRPADVIFPVLHGVWGESGELQEILENRHLPFVGSGSKASRLGMNKVATKQAWVQAGLPTPGWMFATQANVPEVRKFIEGKTATVVKAVDGGSSIDVLVCRNVNDGLAGLDQIVARHGQALVEQFIEGPELTISLLEEKPMPPIRIVPKRAFYDYEAKYNADDTEHRFDTGLPADVLGLCTDLVTRGNAVIGARDLGRIDIMLDANNRPYLLEINTLPGFTPKSLFPEAAQHVGISFGQLVDRLARRAQARGGSH